MRKEIVVSLRTSNECVLREEVSVRVSQNRSYGFDK